MERMRPVSRRVHLMFLNANTAGNDRLWKLLGSMLGAFNWSLHPFTLTHTQHMGTFNSSCNVDNLNQDIVSFAFCTGSSSSLIPPLLPLCFSSFIVPNIWCEITENTSGDLFFCAWMGLHSFSHFLFPLCFIMASACLFAIKWSLFTIFLLWYFFNIASFQKAKVVYNVFAHVCVFAPVC